MCSASEDVQCKRGCAVQVRMFSTKQARHLYEWGCAMRARSIIRTNEDVQYESHTFSAQAKMYNTNQAHHQ